LTTWLRRYADRLTGIEEATRGKYHRYIDIDIDIDPFFDGSHIPVDAVTQDMDAAWVIHLEQKVGNSAKTIHNKHGFLSAGLSAAAPPADSIQPVRRNPVAPGVRRRTGFLYP